MIPLARIRASEPVLRDFAVELDLDFDRTTAAPGLFILSPATPFEVIAGDGGGNSFLAVGEGPVEQRPVFFIHHEGRAGRIAGSLDGLLGLVLALPGWMDVLKFSGGGQLAEMRRAAEWSGTDHATERPELREVCVRLAHELGLRLPEDPVADLHREMSTTEVRALAPEDGTPFDSMFNTFKIRPPPARR